MEAEHNSKPVDTLSSFFGRALRSAILIIIVAPLAAFIVWKLVDRLRNKVPIKIGSKERAFRFRNRDKIHYYAKRLGRGFRSVSSTVNELTSREEKKKIIINFVKNLFNRESDDRDPILLQRELPESFFQPEPDDISYDIPENLKLILDRIRLFWYLDNAVTSSLANFIRIIELNTGDHLYKIGDLADEIYIVKSGQVNLIITDSDGNKTIVHEVSTGGNPCSLIAILDVMSNHIPIYKSAEAVAAIHSTVICLPIQDLLNVCRQYPPSILRLAQMISVRIRRVTFMALHNFFGLDKELFDQCSHEDTSDSAVSSFFSKNAERGDKTSYQSNGQEAGCPTQNPTLLFHKNVPTHIPKTSRATPSLRRLSDSGDGIVTLNEINAPIGFDSSSSRFIPDTQPTALLELGEVLPDVNAKYASDVSDLETHGVSGTERRLVRRSVEQHLSFFDDSSNWQPEGDLIITGDVLPAQDDESPDLLLCVQKDLARLLGLTDPSYLDDILSIVSVNTGDVLSKELELQAELYYILHGQLNVLQSVVSNSQFKNSTKNATLLVCKPGDLVGLMGVITGEPNNSSIVSMCPTKLAVIPREKFFHLIHSYPDVLINATYLMIQNFSILLRLADLAIEWHVVDAGKALYKQGDPSHYMYVVVSGRFREVHSFPDGSRHIVAEHGRGDFIGFVEVSNAKPRINTVLAIRDTELVQIPSLLLNWLRKLTPNAVSRFIEILSDRLMGSLQLSTRPLFTTGQPIVNIAGSGSLNKQTDVNPDGSRLTGGAMSNLKAIAIIPSTPNVNADAFCLELQHAMSVFGSSIRLTSDIINKRVGSNALQPVNAYRLSSWLNHQEDLHRIIFYVGDHHRKSLWTLRCLHQADCVMVLALATSDPSQQSPIELLIDTTQTKVTKLFVLMHTMETDYPQSKKTAAWLNERPWVNQHYHIRCPPRVLTRRSSRDLIFAYSRVFSQEQPNPHSDISRLARCLTGQAVGLVLGGGGAKGGAHIGIIRAMQESGIPIDMIGGTSIGALVGALWAEETRVAQASQRGRDFALIFKSIWPKIRDLTYPTVAIFSGHEFNVHLESTFKDRQIEDLWLPYYCVTTNITTCKMRIHTKGSLWRYVRSSMTYPMLLPPLCDPTDGNLLMDGAFVNNMPGSLWRYVRASMSLSGYMPPLCDPYDGHYLLDGGYVNNLPADIMSSFGAKTIYAVDVGSVYDTNLTNYGDWLSGWWLIYQRFFRWWGPPIRVPNMTEIQSRLAYISCIQQLETIKSSGICHYLRPPIDQFSTLQFSAFEEIIAVGYSYAKDVIASWKECGVLKRMMPGVYQPHLFDSKSKSKSFSMKRNSGVELHESDSHVENTNRTRHMSLFEFSTSLAERSECVSPITDADESSLLNLFSALTRQRVLSLELGSSSILPEASDALHPLGEHWLIKNSPIPMRESPETVHLQKGRLSSTKKDDSVSSFSTHTLKEKRDLSEGRPFVSDGLLRFRKHGYSSLSRQTSDVDEIIAASNRSPRFLSSSIHMSGGRTRDIKSGGLDVELSGDDGNDAIDYLDADYQKIIASDPELSSCSFLLHEDDYEELPKRSLYNLRQRTPKSVYNIHIDESTPISGEQLNISDNLESLNVPSYRHRKLHRRKSLNRLRRMDSGMETPTEQRHPSSM